MKTFLKIILSFLLPIFIFGLMIELLVNNIPNEYNYKNNYIAKKGHEIKTIIIGSSHTYYGLDPKYFNQPTFNLSHVSQTIDLDYELLKSRIEQMPNLNDVIIRLSYTTLFEQLKEGNENWRLNNYAIHYNFTRTGHLKHHSSLLSIKLKKNIDDILNYYVYNKNVIHWTDLGWGNQLDTKEKVDLEKTGVLTAKKHTAKDFSLLEKNTQVLEKLIILCKKKDIRIHLLTLPAYISYRKNIDENQMKTTFEVANKLTHKYINCNYINLFEDPEFISNDFYDGDHLNSKGSKKLSLKLNELISNQ